MKDTEYMILKNIVIIHIGYYEKYEQNLNENY